MYLVFDDFGIMSSIRDIESEWLQKIKIKLNFKMFQ
jgi:hypothetical protein